MGFDFKFITGPINFILDTVVFISCLLSYIGDVFKWIGIAVTEGIKVLISFPFCFGFYLLHLFMEFVLFIIFDVLLIVVLWPSQWLGKALGYPFNIPNNRKKLREIKSYCTAPKLYEYMMPKVVRMCYSFNGLEPFPKWDLKVPEYGKS
jgi:hypothetical protein